MSITYFFENTLRAKLRNQIWSWGAIDSNNRIFLRVWDDKIDEPRRKVLVGSKEAKPGQQSGGVAERKRHIDSIRKGAEAFGVICYAKVPHVDPTTRRHIDKFNRKVLLRLGAISEENGFTYADILGRIPTEQVVTNNKVIQNETNILSHTKSSGGAKIIGWFILSLVVAYFLFGT